MITNCLTYEQLQAYSAQKMNLAERGRLYMHISSCELCAGAVNGFAAIPFASDELNAIHREIDAKTNATAANPLTPARVFIVLVSLLSIAGVFHFSGHPESSPAGITSAAPAAISSPTPVIYETKKTSQEEISSVTKTFKKIVNVIRYKKFERSITPVEQLEKIAPASIGRISPLKTMEADIVAPHFNPDAIYIYDLKVSNYNALYFSRIQPENPSFKTATPASKENKESAADEAGPEKLHGVRADRVLKHALASFNTQDFGTALEYFQLLLENNPNDVNAQFYSALAYYNLDKKGKAVEFLDKVMRNSNDTFYPEAEWYKALVTLKSGNPADAKVQLESIVSGKGFYSKRAAEKLRNL
jgi:tetratricopeptide (TPR) repeat protein